MQKEAKKKRVEIMIYSTINGSLIKRFFKKTLEISSASLKILLTIGTVIPPAGFAKNYGRMKEGAVSNVTSKGTLAQIWVATKSHMEDLRECLIPDGWKEISKTSV